ncbi:MAG: flagellar protein export ATPase FliI [Candidatus Aureabacteria bacterium]|nr:flagellar protein export ATPase FliI [Candidatus Auribacterota bacterium]
MQLDLSFYKNNLERTRNFKLDGRVTDVVGLLIEALGPAASVGELCKIQTVTGKEIFAEVVGFKGRKVLLMPYAEMSGIGPGCKVMSTGGPMSLSINDSYLGRIVNGMGQPIDGKPIDKKGKLYSIYRESFHPLKRKRIDESITTGVRAIDGCLTIGKGQRVGIFSGSGVGKSVLMGMIARNTSADVNVIGLIGERSREVRDFIEKDLQEEGLKRSIVVVVTSDQPALQRIKGFYTAVTMAEYFRDQGKDVMLMVDSVTRFAMAQREVGLAVGEPPATKGYTPSVFAILPKLLERAGRSDVGSTTGLFTVLVEADDFNEPISDAVRSVVDGHIMLTRDLAQKGHYPAVDLLQSTSRVMIDIVDKEHLECAEEIKKILATYKDAEDLINIGAYVKGSNPRIDYAIQMITNVNSFLTQGINDKIDYAQTLAMLKMLFRK